MWKRVLAVGAHPDDVEFGCGGALLRHAAYGASITLVIVSDGALAGDAVLRAAEQEHAAQLLGAKMVMLQRPDGQLGPLRALVSRLEEEIANAAPDLVYTHLPEDIHQDHVRTHQAISIAARRLDNVLLYESPRSSLLSSGISVDISPVIEQKTALLAAHASQIGTRRELGAEAVRARAVLHGSRVGCGYAEMFRPLRFTMPLGHVV
ncbi:N-acetyl-alpha-D-glucosaminyl L-malate deacetylase 1 [Streptomyces sp. RB17]|uniref:PIG-L deacetylase family protein n=1 Tax=Streptomyces sp. RB17 TaxID=2585197 RepID=UPI001295AAA0|nr:PIG-L deacetylase family protein [Streptomyces sp. RB17]MQY32393.1 N-acetyl-alpha-D-glucosaminyl L-malate deacetylase 1 [Streptomyces sp. RB17]